MNKEEKKANNFSMLLSIDGLPLIEKFIDVTNYEFSGFNLKNFITDLDKGVFDFINKSEKEKKLSRMNIHSKYLSNAKWMLEKTPEEEKSHMYVITFKLGDKNINLQLNIKDLRRAKKYKFDLEQLDSYQFDFILTEFMVNVENELKRITMDNESLKYSICNILTDSDTVDENGVITENFISRRYRRVEKIPNDLYNRIKWKANNSQTMSQLLSDLSRFRNQIYSTTSLKEDKESI